jgi:hypothetical protein
MSSSNKSDLRVDWATHAAAKYACEHWHYSGCVPNQKTVKVGAWENNSFIGVVLFGDGANSNAFSPYGLHQTQGCELVRIALRHHKSPVSRIVRLSLLFLKAKCPGVKMIISFADPEQGHHGGVYQAGGWIYAGITDAADEYIVNGVRMHGRALRSTRSTHKRKNLLAANVEEWARIVIDPKIKRVEGSRKHRYLMPLDDEMRAKILPLAQPYPKRPKQATPATSGEAAGQNRPGRSNLPTAGMDEPA